MAVIRARSLDCPGFLILSLLLLVGAGRVLCEGNPQSDGAPTVSQCRPHIEAALKDFVTHHKTGDEQSSVQDRPTEEALQAGEQSQLDTSPTEEGEVTDKGDTVGDDTARATEQDNDETQVEGDDDDEGETEGTAEDGDDQTEAEGATADESKKDDDDDQTVSEGDDDDEQTEGDENGDQTADEQDEQTDGDEVTGEQADEDTGDEETVAEGEAGTEGDEGTADEDEESTAGDEDDEGTAGEDDEGTAGDEDDEGTAGDEDDEVTAGDEDDEDTAGDEDDEGTAGDEDDEGTAGDKDDEGTAGDEDDEDTAGDEDDEGTADDEGPTAAETGGEDDEQTEADDEDDEQTKTEVQEEQTETGGGDEDEDETEGVEGDTEKEEESEGEAKAEESEAEDEKGETEADETAQEAATEDETKEGEEAGDAATAEDVSEAGQTQGTEADEQSGDDGQQSGEEDKGDGTEEDVSEHAASEGDECGGDGQSEADEPEEEEEETAAEEATEAIKRSRGGLRSRAHIEEILGLDDASISSAVSTEKLIQNILKDLKRMYESAIKPMELLYKFKDISNRYVGDSEIFSKPMILFIGPWSSGKSTMINYLLDIDDTKHALPTGAEPKSSDFTVLTHGDTEVMLGGTELAADWTFSTMQKFGQAFLDQLKGMQLPNNLLRKITIVDTPGILENRKIQERTYPFNDVCQWFIDRADIIYVVFDPTKLDMGLEMEALFDQLKGREAQVRIVLNKADTVSPQELMRVQSTLLWNLSPLLGSSEAPTIFVGNFWSRNYIKGSPSTLFEAQEEALLHDLRHVIVGRVENKISFTRRHAVRVRNHAKMVDCYLNTYYNHKTFFGNKKKVADDIIENPQSYHIYEGLSTLTNVSRYDLPDPDIYREFFKVNPLYEFKQLASTCSFFKGCPLDKLDLTISFELPELMGKYRKLVGATPHGAGGDRR